MSKYHFENDISLLCAHTLHQWLGMWCLSVYFSAYISKLQLYSLSAANKLGVDAIFVYTKHGHMASLLSRNRPNPPIFAFTNNDNTRKALNLQWGVTPLLVDLSDDMEANISKTINLIKRTGMLEQGDAVLVVSDVTPTLATPMAFQSIQVKTIA